MSEGDKFLPLSKNDDRPNWPFQMPNKNALWLTLLLFSYFIHRPEASALEYGCLNSSNDFIAQGLFSQNFFSVVLNEESGDIKTISREPHLQCYNGNVTEVFTGEAPFQKKIRLCGFQKEDLPQKNVLLAVSSTKLSDSTSTTFLAENTIKFSKLIYYVKSKNRMKHNKCIALRRHPSGWLKCVVGNESIKGKGFLTSVTNSSNKHFANFWLLTGTGIAQESENYCTLVGSAMLDKNLTSLAKNLIGKEVELKWHYDKKILTVVELKSAESVIYKKLSLTLAVFLILFTTFIVAHRRRNVQVPLSQKKPSVD